MLCRDKKWLYDHDPKKEAQIKRDLLAVWKKRLSGRPLPEHLIAGRCVVVKHRVTCGDFVREQLDNDDPGGFLAASSARMEVGGRVTVMGECRGPPVCVVSCTRSDWPRAR